MCSIFLMTIGTAALLMADLNRHFCITWVEMTSHYVLKVLDARFVVYGDSIADGAATGADELGIWPLLSRN